MASDLNTLALVGNLTRDAELRHTQGGVGILSMRLAVTDRRKRGGEWVDVSMFFNVTVFGARAEPLAQYATKGTRIGITGRLSWREWTDDGGTRREAVEVVAEHLQLLDGRRNGAGASAASTAPNDTSPPADTGGDDLPF